MNDIVLDTLSSNRADVERLHNATGFAAAGAIVMGIKEIKRLRAALAECAAPFRSRPCTVIEGATLLAAEFERRAQIAADALANT